MANRTLTRWLLAFALGLATTPATAALTDSEKAQIQGFVRSAELGNAARVRALVARPDNEADEAAQPLASGYGAVVFDDAHEKFTRELLLGPGSLPSRSEVAPILVRALLGRASAAIAAMPAGETGADARKTDRLAAEVVKIHRFIAEGIANAGSPPADGHDISAGFRDDALKAILKAYGEHFERHAATLGGGQRISPSLVPVRAQSALTVIDLARGVLPRREVADLLGLTGAKRALFERHGTYLEDGGSASPARLDSAVRFAEAAPRALDQIGLWVISKSPSLGLAGRSGQANARVTLGSAPAAAMDASPWPPDVVGARPDRELAEVAYSAAWMATRYAFKARPALREIAARVAERAARAGRDGYLSADLPATVLREGGEAAGAVGASPEQLVVHALRLVLLDAPTAFDLALYRSTQGRDEPAAALVLALSALHAATALASEVEVGKTAPGGAVEALALTGLENTNGLVSKLRHDGQDIELTLLSEGRMDKVRVNGAEPKLSKLGHVRLMPKDKGPWTAGGVRFETLGGEPLGLAVDDGRFVLAAPLKSAGFEAVVAGAESSDQVVSARLVVSGRGGGLLVRGQPGTTSYDGIGVLLTQEPSPTATLIVVDGKGKASELGKVELGAPGPSGYEVTLEAKEAKITALVGDKKLETELSRGVGSGRRGLFVVGDGRIEVSAFSERAPAKAVKKGEDKQRARKADGKKAK